MKKILGYVLLLGLSIMIFSVCYANNKSSMEGILLKSVTGSNIIIDVDNCPIVMGNKTGKEDIFNNLKSGDRIEVTYDLIRESYPAQTEIYSCKLIEEGNISNISKDVLNKLQEMGWKFDVSN